MAAPLIPAELLNVGGPPKLDYVILNGIRTPGRATITGAGSPRTWDKQKGWAMSGATLIFTGDDLSDFEVHVDIWEDRHWTEWTPIAKLLEKRSTGLGAKFLNIIHPQLYRAPLRITAVAVRDVSQWTKSKSGLWSCTIALTDWKAPKPALGKPDASIDKPEQGIADFSNDPQIKALLNQQADLGGGLGRPT